MIRCCECRKFFGEDDVIFESVCWEDYYGVGSSFQNKNYGTIATCPYCGSDELDENYEDDDEEYEDD